MLHAVPGRVRLKIRQLRHRPELARKIQDAFADVSGIRRVSANPLTGSVLAAYDTSIAPREFLADAMDAVSRVPELAGEAVDTESIIQAARAGMVGVADEETVKVHARRVKRDFGSANRAVFRATGGVADLRILVPLALAVWGLVTLATERPYRHPPWWSLIWYGFGTFWRFHV